MIFCFIQISFRIEAITAETDETMEHFQIIGFEDHNKCAAGTTEKIVGTAAFWEQKHRKKASERFQKATAPFTSHL